MILVSALLGAFRFGAPLWATVGLFVALGLCVIAYLVAYGYFMLKSPDALRSERFTLSKLALERSITGDNLAGFIEPPQQAPALPPVESKEKSNP